MVKEKEEAKFLKDVIVGIDKKIQLDILELLMEEGELSFSEIKNKLSEKNESSKLSHHLNKLSKLGIILNKYKKKEEKSNFSFYVLSPFGEDFCKFTRKLAERELTFTKKDQ